MTSQNRQVPQDQGPQAPPVEAKELRQGQFRKNMSSESLLLMACRYSSKAADTEWPQPSAFSSPTEQSLATPQTGQTWSRLYRVGATHYHRADNDYGQFTITNSVRPALSLWLQSRQAHCVAPRPDCQLKIQRTSAALWDKHLQAVPHLHSIIRTYLKIFQWDCLSRLCKIETAAMSKHTCCFHYVACIVSLHTAMSDLSPAGAAGSAPWPCLSPTMIYLCKEGTLSTLPRHYCGLGPPWRVTCKSHFFVPTQEG